MKDAVKNGMRSGLVVIGAIAFGYLSLHLGFKPYLDKAQLHTNDHNNLNRQSDHQLQRHQLTDVLLDDDDSPS